MGAFSPSVLKCPVLSPFVLFVLLGARNEDKSGQTRTNRDKTGDISGQMRKASTPNLALLNPRSLLSDYWGKTSLAPQHKNCGARAEPSETPPFSIYPHLALLNPRSLLSVHVELLFWNAPGKRS